MLTPIILKTIRLRQGPLVKYTVSGGFYWSSSHNSFVPLPCYFDLLWDTTYYLGHSFQTSLLLYLFYRSSMMNNDLEENGFEKKMIDNGNTLTIFHGAGYWLICTTILGIGSIAVQYRDDVMNTVSKITALDLLLQRKFRETNISENREIQTANRKNEYMTIFFAFIPALIGVVMVTCLHHPMDPIRNMFQDTLEIEFLLGSVASLIFILFVFWGVFAFAGIALMLTYSFLTFIFSQNTWMVSATPVAVTAPRMVNGEAHIQTERLGLVKEMDLIWLYRTQQIGAGMVNDWAAKVRMSYVFLLTLLLPVIASFLLIRYRVALLNEMSLVSISVIGAAVLGIALGTFCAYQICFISGAVESNWMEFKKRLTLYSWRRSSVFKVAISLRSTSIYLTYPFFNSNKDTFAEWIQIAVDRLVDLLVAF